MGRFTKNLCACFFSAPRTDDDEERADKKPTAAPAAVRPAPAAAATSTTTGRKKMENEPVSPPRASVVPGADTTNYTGLLRAASFQTAKEAYATLRRNRSASSS
jgi:hypothetical protein